MNRLAIFALGLIGLGPAIVSAQENLGFESGLTGWARLGNKQAVTAFTDGKPHLYDRTDYRTGRLSKKDRLKNTSGPDFAGQAIPGDMVTPFQGHSYARLGPDYCGIAKRVDVTGLSIVQFNARLRSATPGCKGYSFLRFYNAKDQLLLEYRSLSLADTTWQSTGNYTESPPDTRYMMMGVEKDSSTAGYIYADDFSVAIGIGAPAASHTPQCNLEQYMRPFWHADTIFRETVLLYSKTGGPARGSLLYQPAEILSVQSFDGARSFSHNLDYTVDGRDIIREPESLMPFRADTSFDTHKDFAWYNLQSQWVTVTYTHSDSFPGPAPSFKKLELRRTIGKLREGGPLHIAAFGMSITRGLNVSSYDTIPPYMPAYVDLFARQLRRIYQDTSITLYNAALPGSLAEWGAAYADKYINPLYPDLVILDFGMNDFWSYEPAQFAGYIRQMMDKIRARNPYVEFILVSNMLFDPEYIPESNDKKNWYIANMKGYSQELQRLTGTGVVNLDMTSLSEFLYRMKKPKDFLANPLHPNDYMARWYAQGLTALLDPQ